MSENSSPSSARIDQPPEVIGDQYLIIPESVYRSSVSLVRPGTRIKTITLQYNDVRNRSGAYEKLEFNLVEIAKAKVTEAYVMRSFLKHITLILKSGYYLDGRNPETVEYVHMRLRETGLNTNIPWDTILRSVVANLVEYCNAFIIFVRDSGRSMGRSRRIYGRFVEPVAAMFSADPTCMSVKRNDHGDPTEWQQRTPDGQERIFPWYNVVHLHYNREDGFISGTPWIIPVLDDIRALRRLEEIAELIANRHAFPLFHYKVGTETNPARTFDDGTSEVDNLRFAIESMPLEGCLVTSERHEIEAINSRESGLNLEPYLRYWEQRVISGLGLSGVDLGRADTANRATANQMSKGLADFCTDLQQTIAVFVDFYLLDAFLEEGKFPLSEESRVHLKFPPIDIDQMLSLEKHAEYMYQNHLITRTEARQRMGAQPITEEMDKDMRLEKIDIPLAIIKAVDEPWTSESKAAVLGKTSKSLEAGEKKKKNKSENINRPTNQYGKLPAKTKPVRDKLMLLWMMEAPNFIDMACEMLLPTAMFGMESGMHIFCDEYGCKPLFVGKSMKKYFMEKCLRTKLDNFRGPFTSDMNPVRRKSAREMAWPVVDTVVCNIYDASINFGYRYAAMLSGYEDVGWKLSENACEECKNLDSASVRRMTFENLLPRHSQCVSGHTIINIKHPNQ